MFPLYFNRIYIKKKRTQTASLRKKHINAVSKKNTHELSLFSFFYILYVYCVVSSNNSPASTVQIEPPPPLSSVFHFSLSMSPWHQEPCSFSKKFHSKFNIQINGNGNGRPCCSSCLEMKMAAIVVSLKKFSQNSTAPVVPAAWKMVEWWNLHTFQHSATILVHSTHSLSLSLSEV